MRIRVAFAAILGAGVLALLVAWGSVVWSPDPVNHPLARLLPWPVVCTTRGCITTTQWREHTAARATFNTALALPHAAPAETLTTLVRQHLVSYAVIRSAVTAADARRYREEILNAKDTSVIQNATALTLDEYDQLVVLPFLQQEALRQQRHAESAEELFAQLAQERFVVVFVRGLRWNAQEGKVNSARD